MKNLKLQFCNKLSIAIPEAKYLLLDQKSDLTHRSNLIYVGTSSHLFSFNTDDETVTELAEVPGIVGCEYLALDNNICAATSVGEVLIINPETKAITEGTFCDVGIEAMEWSPDQEVVAFVTKGQNVVVMTCTYDPISEHQLSEQSFGEGEFITVGWGKKETQFHGSEGKSAAKQKADFISPGIITDLPMDVAITWRADGAFFAVSFLSQDAGRRFKVFDKEGKLNYTSEKLNCLAPPIAWRPSGTWIVMPQKLPNKSTVALFEKNGLRHREIVLPFSFEDETIVNFKWSPESDILVIETNLNTLYLYTINNYHWYLKQVLTFSANDPISVLNWDCRIGEEKTLHVLLQSGVYIIYRWHFCIDKLYETGLVAVIDGNKLLLTDFSKNIIPPPMSSSEIIVDSYINACDFNLISSKSRLLICDSKNNLHIYNVQKGPVISFEKQGTIRITKENENPLYTPLELNNMVWCSNDRIIASRTVRNKSEVLLFRIASNYTEQCELLSRLDLNEVVIALAKGNLDQDKVFVHTIDGKIVLLSMVSQCNLKLEKLYAQLEQCCDQLQWFESKTDRQTSGLISLKANHCLHIDSKRICEDVTSFCLAGNYLAFTQLTSLKFVRLTDQKSVSERKIERGGKLITIITDDSRTVLQMPRGNLEAIHPRVLSLDIVGQLLDEGHYHAAMDILRKQRININMICDHNMVHFIDNLSKFLSEVQNPNWLNLFLSDLQNEDFTKTMYSSNYNENSQIYPEGFKIDQKTSYICEKLCDLMEQIPEKRFRLPVITAYVKMGKLEKALEIIWQQKKTEISEPSDDNPSEEALKYLLYLVDVNKLYNVALGTYDFSLVLFVANKSQKDPKEFLPFLNELKTFEVNYRKYRIDAHLKRYKLALAHIAQCGETKLDEAIEFIKQHCLFQESLKLYTSIPSCYPRIALAFADYLRANGKMENASIMYERSGNSTQALLSARHVLDWQRVLMLAKADGQDLKTVALSLVASLQENGKHEEAYYLIKTYGSDFSEALTCLIKGKLFLKAIFEARMHNKSEISLIDSTIFPDLVAYANLLDKNLITDLDLFIKYKQRLLAIREKQSQRRLMVDDDYDNNVDECDLLSDTTSVNSSRYTGSSRGTGKTFRSSKNRRKHERKLLSLKEGNPFEDIALIDALFNHITKIASLQMHIRDTCKALMELSEDAMAKVIQAKFKHLLALVQESLDYIWIPEIMTTQPYITGPNIDYAQLQNEQRYALLTPVKRFKPQLKILEWEHEILT